MRAITNTAPGRLEWLDWPLPQPGLGQVRVRTACCGICTTDLKMIAGWQRTACPSIPGHEWSGVVDAIGEGVSEDCLGAPCVAENVLADGGEVGFEHPGGYGPFFLTEARNLHRLPPGFPPDQAALIEPLAVAVHAVRRLRALAGSDDAQRVLIFGDGPMGLLVLMLLHHYGIPIAGLVGGEPKRLELARALGAGQVLDFRQAGADLTAGVLKSLAGPFPFIVEASGSPQAARAALYAAAHAGRVLILGDYETARLDVEWNYVLHQELALAGSNASAGAWPEAVRLALSGDLPLQRLVTHHIPVDQFQQGIDLVRSRGDGVIKAVLQWS
jgi:threonine dehydrogenase-like Zn-dependent dehydrogenase